MLGSGKSILTSTVINHLKSIVMQHKHYSLAYFYFDFRDNQKQDSIRFLASIVCQLLRPQPFLKKAEAIYDRRHQYHITLSDLKSLFIEAISMLEAVYIVVDAMDECNEWSDLHGLIPLFAPDDCKVHFLASSRKENYIEEALRQAGFSCVGLEGKVVDRDIALHVKETIAEDKYKRFRGFSSDLKHYVCSELTARSKGSYVLLPLHRPILADASTRFRWVECQINSLASCKTETGVRSAVVSFPKTLNETYERILNSIREDDKETARRALLWLVLSNPPMTIRELAEAVKVEPRQFDLDRKDFLLYPEALYDICPSMIVERSDGSLGLAHDSVQEYLVSKAAKAFYVDTVKGNAEIASVCLTYMLQEDLQKTSHERGRLIRIYESPNSPFPFLTFASKNWFRHIRDEGIEESIEDLIIQFLLPKQSLASVAWQQVLPEHTGLHDSDPIALHVAALFDLPRTLTSLLRDYDLKIEQVAKLENRQTRPLIIAVEAKHQEIAEILLEAGANPNGRRKSLLYSSQSSVEMTKLLLNYGAEFSSRDYYE